MKALWLLLLWLSTGLMSFTGDASLAAPTVRPQQAGITLGILAYRPENISQQRWQPLARYLQSRLQVPVTLKTLSYKKLAKAIARQQVDFVLTNPAHYQLLAYRYNLTAPLSTLLLPGPDGPIDVFGGVIFTRADSGITELSQLPGHSVAIVTRGSFGGYQMQRADLENQGIAFHPSQLLVTGMPQDRVVEAVLAGKVDVGFVRSGILESMAAEGQLNMASVRVLGRKHLPHYPYVSSTRLYPQWALAALPQVSENRIREVTVLLMGLPHNGTVAHQLNIWGFTIPRDYQPVLALMKQLRVPPFEHGPVFTIADVWQRYRFAVIIIIALVLLSTILFVVIWRRHRQLMRLQDTVTGQRKELAHRMAKEKQLFAALDEGVYGVDSNGLCTFINPAGLKLLKLDNEQQIIGQPIHSRFHRHLHEDKAYPEDDCPIFRTLQDGQLRQSDDEWFSRTDGSLFAVALRVAPMRTSERVSGAVVAFQDITERKKLQAQLEHQATHDTLTGLLNRRQFYTLALREHARIERHGEGAALLLLDLDYFKKVNDTFGHLMGDAVLRDLGLLLKSTLRTEDLASRYGGEEFLLLLPQTPLTTAVITANRLRELIASREVAQDEQHASYTVSIGVTALLASDHRLDTAIARADEALYQAKMNGRNRVEVVSTSTLVKDSGDSAE
ncbi:diguanylate cyclase [Gallaecimonas sp. GXIMD1310]|uniref:diguanylate cyclase n=1 Tax=Gallaecimonas sp. GXIMD1310 TaxID=3131926 RepID=UPI00324BFBF0